MRLKTRSRIGLVCVLLAVLAVGIMVPAALAQVLRFNLEQEIVHLYVNEDGRVQITYDLTFVCDPGADAITVVDIGMPNKNWNIRDVSASIDGQPLTDLSVSTYTENAVAVELGNAAIRPGQRGTLHLEAIVTGMIYQDSKDSEYASIEFIPNYFGSDFVFGFTEMEVNLHFPPGVTADEPRYHKTEFTSAGFEDDRVVYTWVDRAASASRKYTFGASFPQKYLAEGVVQKAPALTINFGKLCAGPLPWILCFGGGWVFIMVAGSLSTRRRKMKYLPPALAVEGTGIKRGLTAVEAAILLEAPLNKVVTMVLFGLLKKGVVTVEEEKPLRVKALDVSGLPEDKLWYYERRFLQAVETDGGLDQKVLRDMVVDLIGDVNKKLTGFSRAETKAYYKDIAARAWDQVEAADTPEVLGERWGEGLEWTMLDGDWDDRTRRVFRDRPVVVPTWWAGHRPWATGSGIPSAPSPGVPRPAGGGGTTVTLPTLPGADFANTVVGGIENAANTVVSKIEGFTGMVSDKTNPPPKPSASSSTRSSSGGGRSCACACACAGCACACAGGGR